MDAQEPKPAPLPWSEALFKALTSHSPDIISLLDAQGRLLFNSGAAERISGFPPEELAGADTMTFMHPDDRALVGRELQGLLGRPGAEVTVQYRYRTKQGGWVWMEAVASNQLHDPDVRGIVATSRDISERKQAEAALRRSEEHLRALATRLRSIREEEAARIARDLHDDLGQVLTAQQMDLRWLEQQVEALPEAAVRDPLLERLVAAREASRQVHLGVQRIAAGAWPVALDKLGLDAALAQEVRHFGVRTGLAVRTRLEGTAAPPPAAAIALFRICQEALTNVARHSGASRVEVELRVEGEVLVLEVSDDGRGYPAVRAEERPSLGLLSMRERALEVGGEVQLLNGPSGGAMVRARVPARPLDPGW